MDSKGAGGISVVIPSFNGLDLLRQNLPSVLAAASYYEKSRGTETEVIVVDDGSSDPTVEKLPGEFPTVRLVARRTNGGFSRACNSGFGDARLPLVALLNNDVAVEEDYLVHAEAHFEDELVFADTAKVFEWDPPLFTTGGRCARFRRGFWAASFNYDVEGDLAEEWIEARKLISFYAIGGFAFYDRSKFQKLGGFNELLSPFHWEDLELSYRAWKRGFVVRYEPRCRAFHQISATIDAHYSRSKVTAVATRNRLMAHWIHLHSISFWASHLLWLALLLSTRFLVLDWNFYRAFAAALSRLSQVRRFRRTEKRAARISDAELARIMVRFSRSAPLRVYYNREEAERFHPETGKIRRAFSDERT